jgi:DNA-binding NarL/FixJ family response regulator
VVIRVLLCDDHELFAEGLAAMLESDGVTVVGSIQTAADLESAIASSQPDIVLMDYQLPGIDGITATRRLRVDHPGLPVVLVTSTTDEKVLSEALEAGAAGFVTKHQSADRVHEAVVAAQAGQMVVSDDMVGRLLASLTQPPTDHPLRDRLTVRETEVLLMLSQGRTTEDIAAALFLSRNTVRLHAQNILTKLGAHSRLEAVAIATDAGLIPTGGRRTSSD